LQEARRGKGRGKERKKETNFSQVGVLRDVNPRLRPVGCSLRVVGRLLRDVGRIPGRRGETKKEGNKERKKLSKKIASVNAKSFGGFFSSLFLCNSKTLTRDIKILKC
jgi:hypothetical protein